MENAEFITVATAEIETPSFGVTQQFLEVHEIAFENGKFKIAGTKISESENNAVVYFSVKDEIFYLAVYLDIEPEIRVRWVGTEDFHRVTFNVYSEEMNFEQLSALTILKPTGGYNKGDKLIDGKLIANGSALEFEPTPGPDNFDSKLKSLLSFLEQDASGIRSLFSKSGGHIEVHSVFYNGTNMLGGFHLDKADIQCLAALNLAIDFDLYVSGNLYRYSD